MQLRAAELSR